MTTIHLITKIKAPIESVFNLNIDIDIHQQSTSLSNETAIAGVTSGRIGLGETVTWRGRHFGIYLTHTSRITAFEFPNYFVDEMEKGKFKSFRHEHFFAEENGVTVMTDKLSYETPFGVFGKLFDYLFLEKHLNHFLLERNRFLKNLAENQN
ncbi:MAG: SRPBCC family protein [Bacteroidota bacterium]